MKMKKLFSSLFFVLVSGYAAGQSFIVDGIRYNPVEGMLDACEVTSPGAGVYGGDIVIPSSVSYDGREYIVSGIGGYAFANGETITSVTLPSTTGYIGRNAFSGCVALTEITLPNNVLEVGEQAFYNCISLSSVNAQGIVKIGNSAFSGCTVLKDVQFGDETEKFGNNVFKNCRYLESYEFPAGAELGSGIFAGCTSLTYAALPPGTENIPSSTFLDCVALKEVVNTENVVTIGENAFQTCRSLQTFDFGKDIRRIGDHAFAFCSDLSITSIEATEAVIGDMAFAGCTSLQDISMNGIAEVGVEAFANDSELKSISFDSTIHRIREKAFVNCDALESVGCYAPDPPFLALNAFDTSTYRSAVLEVETGTGLLYKQSPPWSYFIHVTERKENSGIESVKEQDDFPIVSCSRGMLTVNGEKCRISVYTLSGEIIFQGEKNVGEWTLQVPRNEVLVVNYKDQKFKILSE